MVGTVCEVCRFHPATQCVVVFEGSRRREVLVCAVHRHIALKGSDRVCPPELAPRGKVISAT
jgi:hypothetical protein